MYITLTDLILLVGLILDVLVYVEQQKKHKK